MTGPGGAATGRSTGSSFPGYLIFLVNSHLIGGAYAEADIDAVGAIGAALKLTLEGSVLFDFDQHELKPEARDVLAELAVRAKAMGAVRLVVAGHTDAEGSDAYNQGLSERRAGGVGDFLRQQAVLADVTVEQRGYGESRPVAENESEEGRARNRRVEIVLIPGG